MLLLFLSGNECAWTSSQHCKEELVVAICGFVPEGIFKIIFCFV